MSSFLPAISNPLTPQAADTTTKSNPLNSNDEFTQELFRLPLNQQMCLDLLINGHIRSYIEFFQLVVQDKFTIEWTRAQLETLKSLLTTAEKTLNLGDVNLLYTAKKELAQFFLPIHHDLAISYFREALQAGKNVHNIPAVEVEATSNLGTALEASGNLSEALEYFTTSRALAMERFNQAGELSASQSLVHVHVTIGETYEHEGNFEVAIDHYKQCLSYLKHGAADERSTNDIEYRLGKAYKEIGKIDIAIAYLDAYLSKSKQLDLKSQEAKEKFAMAQAALASCYETSGNPELAANYLQQFVASSENDQSQRAAVSQACNQLGMLYNRIGKFDLAVANFERHYRLVNELRHEQEVADEEDIQQTMYTNQSGASNPVLSTQDASRFNTTSATASQQLANQKLGSGGYLKSSRSFAPQSEVGIRYGAVQTQLGISRGNAQMALFFETVVHEKGLPSLLRWKAERSFGSFVTQQGVISS